MYKLFLDDVISYEIFPWVNTIENKLFKSESTYFDSIFREVHY